MKGEASGKSKRKVKKKHVDVRERGQVYYKEK